jgi:hypothetical protein
MRVWGVLRRPDEEIVFSARLFHTNTVVRENRQQVELRVWRKLATGTPGQCEAQILILGCVHCENLRIARNGPSQRKICSRYPMPALESTQMPDTV